MSDQPMRWRLAFSLRALLLAAVLCSIGAAYFGAWARYWRFERDLAHQIEKSGGDIRYALMFGKSSEILEAFTRSLPWGGNEGWSYIEEVQLFASVPTESIDLSRLQRLHGLRYLTCLGSEFDDDEILQIAKCSQLRSVSLQATQATAVGLRELAKCRYLADLQIVDTTLSDATLLELERLNYLRALQIDIEPSSIGTLLRGRHGSLEVLQIRLIGTPAPSERASVVPFPRLVSLSVTGLQEDDTLASILEAGTQCRFVTLENCHIGEQSSRTLLKLESLRVLSITNSQVVGDDLAFVKRMVKLERLSLAGNPVLDDILNVVPPSVRHLDVSRTGMADGFIELLRKHPQLESIDLRHTKATMATIQKASVAFPGVEIKQ